MHPGVQRENPESGNRGSDRYGGGGEGVQFWRHTTRAEQHHAQKGGFEEKCREHLVAEQRAGDIAHCVHVAGPVGAELERHGDAAHDAERKTEGEHLDPEPVRPLPHFVAAAQVANLEVEQEPAQRDGDHRKQNMETDIQRELHAA